ncbi:MAG: Brp/Blh family beta-carotene 15,15'-dioxygenase [Rubripirellula sp.]
MHSTGVAIASLLMAAASVIGVNLSSLWILISLAVSVVLVGVPHGGLDHYAGRKLLGNRFPMTWGFVFFPAYLAVALLVVIGWFLLPFVTAITFFLISGWHFGLEDDRQRIQPGAMDNLAAVSVGGLVIWIPLLTQSERIASILKAIVPSSLYSSIPAIVGTSQAIAWVLIPIAAIVVARDLWTKNWTHAFRNISFAVLFAVADILISFGIYFCGWHSVRGLLRIARDHELSPMKLAVSAAPLSVGAVVLAGIGMWFWSSGQGFSDATSRTVFVALSAIAVPHLLLHGPITQIARRFGHVGGQPIETLESAA